MSPEEKFLKELNIFKNEVTLVSKFIYTELAIHNIANKDKSILDVLNYSPTFWNTVLSALQNSTFITFGRIFDNNGKSTINTLLKTVKNNRDLFTKESFKNRWLKDHDKKNIHSHLPEYLKKVYTLTDDDMVKFEEFIEKQKDIYKDLYRPIRDHFGHKLYVKNEDVKNLFDRIKVEDLEKFCVRLEGVYESLWQLYHNGYGPLIPIKQGRYSTKNIMKTKFKPCVAKPANAQSVDEVAIVLNLLKFGKVTKDKK